MPSFLIQTSKRLALLLGLLASLPQAHAASVADGATLYGARCAACHGADAGAPALPAILRGRNAPQVIRAAIQANLGGMGQLAALSADEVAHVAAFLGNTPAALNFAATSVGQQSGAQSITVRSSAAAALNGITVNVTGDFRRSGGTCADALPANANCTVDVQFAPTAAGARAGTVKIVHNGIPAGVDFALAGTGNAAAAPALGLSAATLAFGNLQVSATSGTQTLTISNTGNAAMNFTAIALAGPAAADYALGGSCAVANAVAAAGQCTVGVSFRPGAEGARSATLSITSNGGNAAVPLTGTGVAQAGPAVRFSADALAFGNQAVGTPSAPQSVTLTNAANAAINITSLQAAAPFSVSANDCGTSLAPQASCRVQLTFAPTAAGAVSGSLTLVSSATGSPHALALSGTGVSTAAQLAWSAQVIDFGARSTAATDAVPREVTLRNNGASGAVLQELRITGAQAGDFVVVDRTSSSGATCRTGQTLAVNAVCVVSVAYNRRAVGQSNASLEVVSSAGSPLSVPLAGSVEGAPLPLLVLSSNNLEFVRPVGGGNASQLLTLGNTGNAELHVSAMSLTTPSFKISGAGARPCNVGAGAFTVAAGSDCQVQVVWEGGASDVEAALTITSDSPNSPSVVALVGRAASAGMSNGGGGGCTMGQGTGHRDPILWLMALAAAALLWRRQRNCKAGEQF